MIHSYQQQWLYFHEKLIKLFQNTTLQKSQKILKMSSSPLKKTNL